MPLNRKIIIVFMIAFSVLVNAQEDAQSVYDGNNLYISGKVSQAAAKYARALELNPNNRKANFNLGDALYRNGLLVREGNATVPGSTNIPADSLANLIFDQAAQNFAVVANSVSDKDTLHRAWHNIGNCYLQKKEFEQAVTAYKKALKYDPKDEETRYNLAYALKNLPKKKNEGGGGSQNQQQQQNKEEQKKQQQQQQQQSEMSKEQAEQLLKALMDQEKKLQDKRKQKAEDSQRQIGKDW